MQLEETLAFTRIHEADDHDQWNGHINEIAKKTPPKLLEGNHCVSSSQTKTNTTRKSAVIKWQLSRTKHQTITFTMKWQCLAQCYWKRYNALQYKLTKYNHCS
jgi:hypothetical protein